MLTFVNFIFSLSQKTKQEMLRAPWYNGRGLTKYDWSGQQRRGGDRGRRGNRGTQ